MIPEAAKRFVEQIGFDEKSKSLYQAVLFIDVMLFISYGEKCNKNRRKLA